MCEWSGVARWERCVSGVRWQGGKGGRIVRWHVCERTVVVFWERWEGSKQRRRDGI